MLDSGVPEISAYQPRHRAQHSTPTEQADHGRDFGIVLQQPYESVNEKSCVEEGPGRGSVTRNRLPVIRKYSPAEYFPQVLAHPGDSNVLVIGHTDYDGAPASECCCALVSDPARTRRPYNASSLVNKVCG